MVEGLSENEHRTNCASSYSGELSNPVSPVTVVTRLEIGEVLHEIGLQCSDRIDGYG
jgi:hypothetical protein